MRIITLPNGKLRKISEEVKLPLSDVDKKIADELIAYLEEASKPLSLLRPGIGLAAIQLGYLKRMFYVDFKNDGKHYKELLINPVILESSKEFAALDAGEGCLSIKEEHPNQAGLVHRKFWIRIKGYSYFTNEEVEFKIEGFPAIVYQHEMDHIDGKLFIDRINKKRPWDRKDGEIII